MVINVNSRTAENDAWTEYNRSGTFDLAYGNGMADTFNGLGFYIDASEYKATDRKFDFSAGFVDTDDSLADSLNVPESVFKSLFPSDTAYWNAAESYHEFICPAHETIAETMARVANTLVAAGFTWRTDWADSHGL